MHVPLMYWKFVYFNYFIINLELIVWIHNLSNENWIIYYRSDMRRYIYFMPLPTVATCGHVGAGDRNSWLAEWMNECVMCDGRRPKWEWVRPSLHLPQPLLQRHITLACSYLRYKMLSHLKKTHPGKLCQTQIRIWNYDELFKMEKMSRLWF